MFELLADCVPEEGATSSRGLEREDERIVPVSGLISALIA